MNILFWVIDVGGKSESQPLSIWKGGGENWISTIQEIFPPFILSHTRFSITLTLEKNAAYTRINTIVEFNNDKMYQDKYAYNQ